MSSVNFSVEQDPTRVIAPKGIETLTDPTILRPDIGVSSVTTTGAGSTATLPDGTQGALKVITLAVDGGGNLVVTPANLADGTTLTFDTAGDLIVLVFVGTSWYVIQNTSVVIT